MYCFHKCATSWHFLQWKYVSILWVVWLRIKYKEHYYGINSNCDIKQESVSRTEPSSSSSLFERPLWHQQGAPSPPHTVPLAPELMYHLRIAVISVWWMFSEWSQPRVPQTGACVAGCSSEEMGPLFQEVCYASTPLLSRAWVLNPAPPPSPFILLPCPILQPVVSVCTCMHVCSHVLLTGLHRDAGRHPGAMPGLLQSTLLPSFGLMNG